MFLKACREFNGSLVPSDDLDWVFLSYWFYCLHLRSFSIPRISGVCFNAVVGGSDILLLLERFILYCWSCIEALVVSMDYCCLLSVHQSIIGGDFWLLWHLWSFILVALRFLLGFVKGLCVILWNCASSSILVLAFIIFGSLSTWSCSATRSWHCSRSLKLLLNEGRHTISFNFSRIILITGPVCFFKSFIRKIFSRSKVA